VELYLRSREKKLLVGVVMCLKEDESIGFCVQVRYQLKLVISTAQQ
jgi:hypothetical protein